MTMAKTIRLAAATAAGALLATTAGAATLVTPFDGDDFNDGVMFDVTVKAPLTLRSIGVNADGGTFDYAVYYRAGGIGGQAGNAAAWTLLGSFAATTTAGAGAVTTLDIADTALAQGEWGFYVTDMQGAFSVQYTYSSGAVGDVVAEDSALAIRTGYSVAYPFGDTSSPRAANVVFDYATGAVPEPGSWALMIGGVGLIGGVVRRRVRFAFA